jgi:RNA polymerase sigma factor (sigma-70 family)
MDYKEYMRKAPINTNEQNIEYINQGNYDAVVNGNLRYAAMMANKYGKVNNYDDLMQEAIIGLWNAAQNFDTSTNHSFVVYSSWYIKKQIFEYFDSNKTIRIPNHIKRQISTFNKLSENEYFNIYDHQEDFDKSVFDYFKDPISTYSIDVPDITHYSVRPQEIEDKGVNFEDYESEDITKKIINKIVDELKPRYKFIVTHYYGLNDAEELNTNQIAKELGISRQAVHDQLKRIQDKIKNNLSNYPGF